MELSKIQFPDFVSLVSILWTKGYGSVNQAMRTSGIIKVESIPANSGDTRKFSEFDTNKYMNDKGENEQAERAKFVQGYSKVLEAKRIAENFEISYEMRTQNKYTSVLNTVTSNSKKGVESMELDMSHILTFGTVTSYTDRSGKTVDTTVGDGLALFSTAHKLTGSPTTYRNILANNPKLSQGSLEAMENLVVTEAYNNFGEKSATRMDILWTTDNPNTVNTARKLLFSTADVDGSNSGVLNANRGKYRHVILPLVATDKDGVSDSTKQYCWGLSSSEDSQIMLGVWEEPHLMQPQANGNTEDVQTDAWTFRQRAGYGTAALSGRGNFISKGDATA
jgi:hypothetical protein